MKTIKRTELLDQLESEVESHLQTAITIFQNARPELLQQPAAHHGWSIAQCLWHINSYGHYYLPAIAQAMKSDAASRETFTSSWLGAYFTRLMKPGEGMKKMKAFKDHTPPAQPDGRTEVAEFIRQQEVLLGLLRQARQVDLTHTKVAISLSRWIKLRLGDVFQFYVAHQGRHVAQAMRNV
jgi:hypothetical protein